MKHLLITLIGFFLAFKATSQVETVIIEGKTYFVYPYQEEVSNRQRYYEQYADKKEILIRDDQNRKVVSVEYEEIYHTPAQVKAAKKASKHFIHQLEVAPHMMYDEKMTLMKDITPALEKLPDGNYVQYYRDIPYIKDRVLRYKNDVIAGFFTIKNNQLEGESTWFYGNGKVLKKGKYYLGSKQGVWSLLEYEANYEKFYTSTRDIDQMTEEQIDNLLIYDTLAEYVQFRNGIRNGKYIMKSNSDTLQIGEYYDNRESGTWKKYGYKKVKTKGVDGKYYMTATNELILKSQYTVNPNGDSRAKSVIIRKDAISSKYRYQYEYDYETLNPKKVKFYFKDTSLAYGDNQSFPDFTSFMTFATAKEELDLPEEEYHSFEGGEEDYGYGYYGDGEYGGEYYDGAYDPYGYGYDVEEEVYSDDDIFKYIDGKRFLINHLVDSLGYHYNYEGEMLEYHDNGQLKYRILVKDGKIVEQSPCYFDNGQIANNVYFKADSNIYVEEFYDYFGKLYHVARFDSTGRGIVEKTEKFDNTVMIRDRKYGINWGEPTLNYSTYKELEKGIENRQLVIEKIWKEDSTVAAEGYFDPNTRIFSYSEKTLSKKPYLSQEVTFGEDYESVTAKSEVKYKNIQLNTLSSGTYEEWNRFYGFPSARSDSDSVSLQARVLGWEQLYNMERDNELLVNGIPFTGKVHGISGTSKYKFSATDKAINYSMPTSIADQKAYYKTMKQFHKGKTPELLDAYVPEFAEIGKITQIPASVIYPFYQIKNDYGSGSYGLDDAFSDLASEEEYYPYEYEDYYNNRRVSKRSTPTEIEGKYINGKMEGLWTVKDQYGKVVREFSYMGGEMNGTSNMYSIEYPKEKLSRKQKHLRGDMYYGDEEYYYGPRIPEEYNYPKPKKKTYYLETKWEYANGYPNGAKITFNWLGDTIAYVNYKNGNEDGKSFERNKLFYAERYYEDGAEDGPARTWLTPIGKDSILLFELNFQNGALQGQSLAFHTNGKIAKKGFFLSGQPIDDYEAFDTLGVRYQYVKFQYNQPVEEKIWEENQLSVRYEFDWKDSVYFNVRDITNASSIDRLINQIGFDDGAFSSPYYGRPSVLDKTGVNYKMTKYYPNDTVARTGQIEKGKKVGVWNYYSYEGVKLMEVNYFDTIIQINDTLKFKSKGILTYVDKKGVVLSKNWIIEKFEKYDCAHTDHNEERMLLCFWEKDTAQHRINGYTKNYYDNGSIQNEGFVKNGIPVGVWKMYDVDGHLSHVGTYNNGKREGRWLSGDLGDVKNMSEICLNPNLQNLDEILNYQENLLDISVIYYNNGKEIRREYYGINKNNGKAPKGYGRDDYFIDGY